MFQLSLCKYYMTKNELKEKTTYELQRLQESWAKEAIELINDGLYSIAIKYLNMAVDIDLIIYRRQNGFD